MLGMTEPTSFRSIIELWASREGMAADVGAKNWAVIKWFKRDNIPAEWWSAVLATERARDGGVTAELLARLAAREPALLEDVRA